MAYGSPSVRKELLAALHNLRTKPQITDVEKTALEWAIRFAEDEHERLKAEGR